jgi:superfamily II DNA or RNA helicase
MRKIDRLRKETYNEAIEMLDKYGKCAIIRPTGFGKTGILTKVMKSGKYNNILYLSPFKNKAALDIIGPFYYGKKYNKNIDYIPNVTFMSYMKISRLKNLKDDEIEELGFNKYDLIICDECHKLGGAETMNGLLKLQKEFNIPILGATATPERMDMIDEIAIFFDDHIISRYTLHDAFQDGILRKPYYSYCICDPQNEKELEKLISEAEYTIGLMTNSALKEKSEKSFKVLKSKYIELVKLKNMENVISEVVDESGVDKEYQCYIIFFSKIENIKKNEKVVKGWFKKAFPNHKVNTIMVSSENKETKNNRKKIVHINTKKNQIDLILCCNMVNMGVHLDILTGIIMYRCTISSIIFNQQLGRILTSGDNIPRLVIDVVNNIHRLSEYGTFQYSGKETKNLTEEEKKELIELTKKTGDKDKNGKPEEMTEEEMERFIELLRQKNNTSDNDNESDYRDQNVIYYDDLKMIHEPATYEEIIAKTVAEIIAMRCRLAWNRWVEKGGDPSVMTKEYILAQVPPEYVPLAPFCKLKNVTVNKVLETMGVV